MNSYKELTVWQKAVELTIDIYRITTDYPKSELYGLVQQTRRSAVSIPSNVAEGWARKHRQEYLQFLNVAIGSAAELETQIVIAKKLKFLSDEDSKRTSGLITEVMKMLNAFMTSLKSKSTRP